MFGFWKGTKAKLLPSAGIEFSDGRIKTYASGSPEGVITATVGSEYTDTATGILYLKTSGSGNTGWNAVNTISLSDALVGGLTFASTSLPPIINAGSYQVNGKTVNILSNLSLALSDTIGVSLQTLDTYAQYLVLLDNTGAKKYIMYGEGSVAGANGNISGVVESPAGTFTMTKSTGTVASYTNKVLILFSGSTTLYAGKITGGDGSTTIVFKAPNAASFAGATTWAVYERTSTLHGTGSATAITTDADVIKYTPSYGQNSWPGGTASLNTTLGAYYMSLLGLTGYRVLGNFRTDGSGNVLTNIISHKSGSNKNDNRAQFSTVTGWGSTANKVVTWTNMYYLFGCDYVYETSNVNGMKMTIKTSGIVSANFCMTETVSTTIALTVNASSLTTAVASLAQDQVLSIAYSVANQIINVSESVLMFPNDILRTQSNQQGSLGGGEKFNFQMVL